MPLHIALLEACPPATVGAVARECRAANAALHLIGPLPFATDDPALVAAGPPDWGALDWWLHPGWRDFRDAMSRERCLYFASDAENDPGDAPFRPNSVLVFGDEALGIPDKIREKYPERLFRLPRAVARTKGVDLATAIAATLAFAGKRTRAEPAAAGDPVPAEPRRGGRPRSRARRQARE